MNGHFTDEEAVLRVGEVCEVAGRAVIILVDKNKNLSDLFYQGKVLRNVSVGSFIEIKKGFLSLIGKVESERLRVRLNRSRIIARASIGPVQTPNFCVLKSS